MRKIIRNPDGTTKIINETVSQQSTTTPVKSDTQKVQVMRGADGKLSVRGLPPNHKLVQTSEGKFLILPNSANSKWHMIFFFFRINNKTLKFLVVGGKVQTSNRPIAPHVTQATSPVVVSQQQAVTTAPKQIVIRSVPKTIISANNVLKLATEPKVSF